MSKHEKNLWQGVDPGAQEALKARDYRSASFAQELSRRGLDARELVSADRNQREVKKAWIPGVEIFSRKIHPQRHRGLFGADWLLAEAMVGCADVRAHGKGVPRASAQHSCGHNAGKMAPPIIHSAAEELFAASLR